MCDCSCDDGYEEERELTAEEIAEGHAREAARLEERMIPARTPMLQMSRDITDAMDRANRMLVAAFYAPDPMPSLQFSGLAAWLP